MEKKMKAFERKESTAKTFEKPALEYVHFDTADVIRTSGPEPQPEEYGSVGAIMMEVAQDLTKYQS